MPRRLQRATEWNEEPEQVSDNDEEDNEEVISQQSQQSQQPLPPTAQYVQVDDDTCAVCIQQMNTDEQTHVLEGCGHRFHTACAINAFRHNSRCPTCRNNDFDVTNMTWAETLEAEARAKVYRVHILKEAKTKELRKQYLALKKEVNNEIKEMNKKNMDLLKSVMPQVEENSKKFEEANKKFSIIKRKYIARLKQLTIKNYRDPGAAIYIDRPEGGSPYRWRRRSWARTNAAKKRFTYLAAMIKIRQVV